MVFAGIYPLDPGGFTKLEEAIRRLTLTDRSVTSNRESSTFLGQGFRLGFNGSLHMDVFRQRLEDEFGEEVIVTRPLVPVKRASASSLLAALPLGGSPVLPAPFVRHAAQSRSRTARSARSTTRLTSPTRVACSRWSGSRSP